jgi:hypothetical protein
VAIEQNKKVTNWPNIGSDFAFMHFLKCKSLHFGDVGDTPLQLNFGLWMSLTVYCLVLEKVNMVIATRITLRYQYWCLHC